MPDAACRRLEWDYVDRRLGRRRRHARGAPGRGRHARVPARGRRRSARDAGARPARGLRRAGLPCLRLARTRRCAGTSACATTPTTNAAGARPEVRSGGTACCYPRAGDARRLHRAQRDDLHAAARLPTGTASPQLTGDASLARVAHAALRAARGRLPPPAGLARAAPCSASIRPGHGWGGWLRTEKCDPAGGARRRRPGARADRRHDQRRSRAACATPLAQPLALAARPRRPERAPPAARQLRGRLLHAAVDRRHRRAGARERLLDVAAQRIPTACTSSSTRWPRACSSTTTARPCGVEYLKGKHLYRAHAAPSSARRRAARGARAARGDPVRRRLQHAAAADAVRHRPGRRTATRTASRCASTCPASAATCRTATRSRVDAPHARALGGPGRRALRPRRPAVARLARARASGMYASNGAALGVVQPLGRAERGPEPDLFCMALLAQLRRLLPRLSRSVVARAAATASPGPC